MKDELLCQQNEKNSHQNNSDTESKISETEINSPVNDIINETKNELINEILNDTMKKCNKCQVVKPLNEFYKRKCKKSKCKRVSECNKCSCDRSKQRTRTLTEKQKEYFRNKRRNYYDKHKIRITKKLRNRKLTDINYRLSCNLRSRFYNAIKRNFKSGSAVRDLGCSIDELKQYLSSKFLPGMTWINYGEWHIDHIIPLDSFDLSNKEHCGKACHYSNLQPLWAKDNLSKRNNKIG